MVPGLCAEVPGYYIVLMGCSVTLSFGSSRTIISSTLYVCVIGITIVLLPCAVCSMWVKDIKELSQGG